MSKISLEKKARVTALVTLFIAVAIVVPSIAFASSATTTEDIDIQVTAYAKGLAIQKIGNKTVKMPANLTLAAEPIRRGEKLIAFKIIDGKVDINDMVYTISEGSGVVVKPQQAVWIHCKGSCPDGTEVRLNLYARYFWMGGHLCVARIKGILKIGEDTRTLLLMRGLVRIP